MIRIEGRRNGDSKLCRIRHRTLPDKHLSSWTRPVLVSGFIVSVSFANVSVMGATKAVTLYYTERANVLAIGHNPRDSHASSKRLSILDASKEQHVVRVKLLFIWLSSMQQE
jgi:hypothetical protein